VIAGCIAAFGAIFFLLSRPTRFVWAVLAGGILWPVFTLTLSFRLYGVDRFLVPAGGLFVVLAFAGLAESASRAWRRGRLRPLVTTVGLGLVAGVVWSLFALDDEIAEIAETGEREQATLYWLAGAVPPVSNVMLVGAWDQVSEGGMKSVFLFARDAARFDDLDVKAVRVDKVYEDTKRLEHWLSTESRWRPEGAKAARPRMLVVLHPARGAPRQAFDPALLRPMYEVAERAVTGRTPVTTRNDELGRYEVYRLPD
jgi:hypothetical protein